MKPKHIAIILDGNRRYAKKHMIELGKGHKKGAKKVEQLLEWCQDLGIKELTLYSFSTENFKRSTKEIRFLMALFKKQFKKLEKDERIMKEGIRINFIGRISMFPNEIQDGMKRIMEKTKHNKNFTINFAMGYGGRQEIADAVNKAIKKGAKNIDEKMITENLYMSDEPDLIIRTGGERRVSNFLIWQGVYSEYFFTEKLWPEFGKEDLIKVIEDFKKRERRFGE